MNSFPASADVVVVGGGIMGLTTALELARAGAQVCVLDRGLPGHEASWAGGGILSPLPPDAPVPEIISLLEESLARFPAYCAELREVTGVDPEYWACGARVLEERVERWFPAVPQVRNPRLIKALLLALRQRGVRLMAHAPASGWRRSGDRLVGVVTRQGVIACSCAVLAGGAWSGQLADLAIRPVKGQMLLLRGRAGTLDHIRMDDQAYLIPRRDGRLLVGSTIEHAVFDCAPTVAARSYLLECAARLWPGCERLPLEHHWAGLRPQSGLTAPFIGPIPAINGLFANTGHFRLGLTLSLASAQRSGKQVLDAMHTSTG